MRYKKSVVGNDVSEAGGHVVENLIGHFKDLMLLSVGDKQNAGRFWEVILHDLIGACEQRSRGGQSWEQTGQLGAVKIIKVRDVVSSGTW